MRVTVTTAHPAQVKADVVIQLFSELSPGIPLARHLARNARALINIEIGGLTWLEGRRMAAPRVLMACVGSPGDRSETWAPCGGPQVNPPQVHDRGRLRVLGAAIERAIDDQGLARVVIAPASPGIDVARVLEGMLVRAYAPLEFLPDEQGSSLTRVTICTGKASVADARAGIEETLALVEATNIARTLADLPANIGTPPEIARRVRAGAAQIGLRSRVIDRAAAKKLGMGLLLGVAAGSANPPCLLVLEHNASRRPMPTLVLLGKGVTHDTGAYNLKRSRLHDMSYDKAGAAAVVGAMHAIARLALPVRVIGLAPLVENLIDAKAFKPGDILTALDGTTVFVENTDAEGRLVLADCLVYARRFEPDLMIDVATLTDAATVALGDPYAALFTNDDAARELMVAAGEECGELLWPMPIHAEHVAALRHHRARLRNIGSLGGAACSAAAFLRQFVDSPWVHVDMGDKGVATHERDDMGPGATGYGTRLLVCAAQAFARRYAATEQESV